MRSIAIIALFFFLALPGYAQTIPQSVLLDVPFFVQAPLGDWSWPWQDFCEEATVVMAYSYVSGKPLDKLGAALEMLQLAIFELKTFGHEKDTTVADTERMLRDHYGYRKTRIVEKPSVDFIKAEVSKGNLIIVPVAGRLLKNPHFVPPGPRYHMFVIRGFSGGDFIVNEPGTRNGAAFRYSMATVMGAMHDFIPYGDIAEGRKAVLVVEKD